MQTTRTISPTLVVLLLLSACGSPDDPDPGTEPMEAPIEAAAAGPTGNAPDKGVLLGTIAATLDGAAATWHVTSGQTAGRPYSGAIWYEPDSESTWGVVGGFDTPDPPVETFELSESGMLQSFGDYEGSLFTLVLAISGEPEPFRVEFPDLENASSVVYMSEARTDAIDGLYAIESGMLEVIRFEISNGQLQAEGTFSGVFESPTGDQLTISDGRFSVEGAPHLDTLAGN